MYDYIEGFRGAERLLVDCLYHYQIAVIDGSKTIGKQDIFRLIHGAERLVVE